MRGRPITPGLVNIARRSHEVLGLSWATIGHLLDRDPTALRRAVKAAPLIHETGNLSPCRSVFFNAGTK